MQNGWTITCSPPTSFRRGIKIKQDNYYVVTAIHTLSYHLSKVALKRAVLGEDVRKQWLFGELGGLNREACTEVLAVLVIRYHH